MNKFKNNGQAVAHVTQIEPLTGFARIRYEYLQNGHVPFDILDPLYLNQAKDSDVLDAECFRFFVSALVADIAGEEFTPQQRMLKSMLSATDKLTLETARSICIAAMQYVGDMNGKD